MADDHPEITNEEIRAELRRRGLDQAVDDAHARSIAAADAWTVPSAFTNQFHVNVGTEGLTRLTFGEATDPGGVPVSWRVSVTLTTRQALDLANFIWNQYDEEIARREALKKAEAEEAAKEAPRG